MKKLASIAVSLICIVLVVYGMTESLDFSSWIPIDILLAILLLINSLISYSKDNDGRVNINLVMFAVIIIAFITHSHYEIWQIIDIGIIISSFVSIILVIKIKDEKRESV